MKLSDTLTIELTKLPPVKVSDSEGVLEIDWEAAKVKIDKEALENYREALRPEQPFLYRVGRFLSGQSKAGRIAKIVKDFALFFIPYGNKVETVTDVIANIIKEKMPEETKSPVKSKTIIAFGLVFVASILAHFELLPADLVLSPDAAWVATATSVVGIALRYVTKQPLK